MLGFLIIKMEYEYKTAAAIITAVETETQAVESMFENWERLHYQGDSQIYYKTSFSRDGRSYEIVTAQQKIMGMVSASILCSKVISIFKPRYLIMCGIAAGIGDNVEEIYGDILVPDTVWDYTTGKFIGSDEAEIRFGDIGFLPRPVSLKTDESILEIIREIIKRKDFDFHIHIGPMACGSSIVANRNIVEKQVLPLFPTTVGLDMESYSVVYAAKNFLDPKPQPIIIKGICDYADKNKSDRYQRFAAYTSSRFAKDLIEEYLPLE